MWCTRWYLPLLLLPFPTAPPFFLLVLLCSLTLHARPCLYCIVLLVALFTSSCYWAPTPLDIPSHVLETALPGLLYGPPTPLHDLLLAANATPSTNGTNPHVTYTARLERPKRCWCAPHNLFEPFNITRWESKSTMSVIARRDFWGWLVDEPVDLPEPPSVANQTADTTARGHAQAEITSAAPDPSLSSSSSSSWQSRWATLFHERVASYGRSRPSMLSTPKPDGAKTAFPVTPTPTRTADPASTPSLIEQPSSSPSLSPSPSALPRQYDLRPYGGGIILDFGWGRPKENDGFSPEAHVFTPHTVQ